MVLPFIGTSETLHIAQFHGQIGFTREAFGKVMHHFHRVVTARFGNFVFD